MNDPFEDAVRAVTEAADRQYQRMQTPQQEAAMQSLMDAPEDEICSFLEQYYDKDGSKG